MAARLAQRRRRRHQAVPQHGTDGGARGGVAGAWRGEARPAAQAAPHARPRRVRHGRDPGGAAGHAHLRPGGDGRGDRPVAARTGCAGSACVVAAARQPPHVRRHEPHAGGGHRRRPGFRGAQALGKARRGVVHLCAHDRHLHHPGVPRPRRRGCRRLHAVRPGGDGLQARARHPTPTRPLPCHRKPAAPAPLQAPRRRVTASGSMPAAK